jgi:hypothetical protein
MQKRIKKDYNNELVFRGMQTREGGSIKGIKEKTKENM